MSDVSDEDTAVKSPLLRGAPDAVASLSVFAFLLIVIPSRLIFAPLGGAGTPAQVLGIGLALWWVAIWLSDPRGYRSGVQPVRRAMLLFAAAILASYIVATSRPIDPAELRSADMGLLSVCAWLGVVLVLSDHIPTYARLDRLLKRLVALGGAIATLGVLQFITGQSFLNYFQVPGLTSNSSATLITDRSGFNRPAGTALHPIEFGVVLTMVLPLALHFALMDRHRGLVQRWWPVAVIVVALPIAISRSAIVGAVVDLAVLLPAWRPAVRRRAYVAIAALGAMLFVAVPGLLGTLTGLFTGIGTDSSAQSRTGSYTLAGQFISKEPLFGRGFLTFLPSYRILDNQYLGAIIELGFVGTAALLGVFITAILTARRVRRESSDERTRHLAQAVTASVATVAVGYAFFDAFSFPMAASLTFFMVGLAGALQRMHRDLGDPPENLAPVRGRRPQSAGDSTTSGRLRTGERGAKRWPGRSLTVWRRGCRSAPDDGMFRQKAAAGGNVGRRSGD